MSFHSVPSFVNDIIRRSGMKCLQPTLSASGIFRNLRSLQRTNDSSRSFRDRYCEPQIILSCWGRLMLLSILHLFFSRIHACSIVVLHCLSRC